MKLWQKNTETNNLLEKFTVGNELEDDLKLAPFDILGSLAHARMLNEQGLLPAHDYEKLRRALRGLYDEAAGGTFSITKGAEDVHTEVENRLVALTGDAGKRLHTARSRNDQVLLDIRLYLRQRMQEICGGVTTLFTALVAQAKRHKDVLLPGYTHMQAAMPSSFGLWFGAFAESLADDLEIMLAAYKVVNRNPLGSAAGYGSSFNINRERTTELLGFAGLNVTAVYAQMGRGKTERFTAAAIAAIAGTLNKLAMDNCLFINENYGFISLPVEYTTGSSIMPHKKNPDGWELVRGRTASLMALANEINLVCTNLPSGYNRDMQVLKGRLMNGLDSLEECLELAAAMVGATMVKQQILNDSKYEYVFSVEEVNRLVAGGMPFRDAYRQVAVDIEDGTFKHTGGLNHTHTGSIGNPGLELVEAHYTSVVNEFGFEKATVALKKLMEE